MAEEKKTEELVRVYRDNEKDSDIIIEVLGEPKFALKQMRSEPFLLKEKDIQDDTK